MNRIVRSLSAIALLGTLAGCSQGVKTNYDSQAWYEVSGVITLDGQPLSGAYVKFVGDDQISASAVTDSNGHYRLAFDSQQSGITPGSKKVQIRTNYQIEESTASEGDGQKTIEKLPARYHDETTLVADVGAGKTEFDYALSMK